MIVVEGCDGTGKSSLVKLLSAQLNVPIHGRACTSQGGPIKDLFEWAAQDVDTFHTQPCAVYDRHPFISEYIYGPIARGRIDSRFHGQQARSITRKFAYNALVIYCDPGMKAVSSNIRHTSQNQMPGVNDNADAIYLSYASLMHYWPGQKIVWDYLRPQTLPLLIDLCRDHLTNWKEDF